MAAVMSKLLIKVANKCNKLTKLAINLTPALEAAAKGSHIPGYGVSASEAFRNKMRGARGWLKKNQQAIGGIAGAGAGALGGGAIGSAMDPQGNASGGTIGALGGAAAGAAAGAMGPGKFLIGQVRKGLRSMGNTAVGGRKGLDQLRAGRMNKMVNQEAHHSANFEHLKNVQEAMKNMPEDEILAGAATDAAKLRAGKQELHGLGADPTLKGKPVFSEGGVTPHTQIRQGKHMESTLGLPDLKEGRKAYQAAGGDPLYGYTQAEFDKLGAARLIKRAQQIKTHNRLEKIANLRKSADWKKAIKGMGKGLKQVGEEIKGTKEYKNAKKWYKDWENESRSDRRDERMAERAEKAVKNTGSGI